MYRRYNLEEVLKNSGNIAIQGEIAGFWDELTKRSIQSNRLKLDKSLLFVFNVFNIDEQRYYDRDEFLSFCAKWKLDTVPIDIMEFTLDHTVDELLEMAKGTYESGFPREGIVVRTVKEMYCKALHGRASFKVINNDFLLKT
jgi:ATP-dependent RNA circularization protein (DNA/RNA ligase family)